MSFWKQLPPKPTEADKNLGPTRESVPMECATCNSVAHQTRLSKTACLWNIAQGQSSECCAVCTLNPCILDGLGGCINTVCLTCCTSAPVASHNAEMELMEEMRCARKALAVSLDSSADHRLAHRIRSSGIQCSYTLFRTFTALAPLSVSLPPMSTCR